MKCGYGVDDVYHRTHQHTTTLSNEEVVAELGWTSLLIHNSTGGLVPRFWRPPYGDTGKHTSSYIGHFLKVNRCTR
jgi:chitin deacetylase